MRALGLPGDGQGYITDYGPLRFVAIGVEADAGDVPLVREALARPGARHVYVVVHRPPPSGSPVLAAARGRATAVIAGHNHRDERRVVDGVPLRADDGPDGVRMVPIDIEAGCATGAGVLSWPLLVVYSFSPFWGR